MGRREDNKRRKLEAIEKHGLRLFLEVGYDRASIEQVAAAADVARGTFYLYFADKRALFDALMDRWSAPVLDVLDAVASEISSAKTPAELAVVYRGMAVGLGVVGLAQRDEILVAFREARQPGEAGESVRRREAAILDAVVVFTRDAKERGLLNVGDPRLACLVVMGAVERLFYEFLAGAPLGDPLVVAEEVLGLFGRAMGFDFGSTRVAGV